MMNPNYGALQGLVQQPMANGPSQLERMPMYGPVRGQQGNGGVPPNGGDRSTAAMPHPGGYYPGGPPSQRIHIGVPGGVLPQPPGLMAAEEWQKMNPPPQPAPQQPQYGWGNPQQSWGAPPQQPAAGPQPGPAPEAPLMPSKASRPVRLPRPGPAETSNPYGPDYYRRYQPKSLPPQASQPASQLPGGRRDVEYAFNNKGAWRYQDPQQAARQAIDKPGGAGWSGNRHLGAQQAYNAAVKNNWLSPESMDFLRGMTPSNRQAYLMNSGVFNNNEVKDIARRLNAKKGRRR